MPQLSSGPRDLRSAQRRGPAALTGAATALASHVSLATAAPLLLVSGAAVGMFSVPRYHLGIVLTYLGLLGVLATVTWRTRPGAEPAGVDRVGGAIALAATAAAIWTVPSFSYLTTPQATAVRLVVALAAIAAAIGVATRSGGDLAALLIAAAAYAATAAATIRLDPAPRIDVWYTLQAAADNLARGENFYDQLWVGPPGPMAAFTYLPGTAVLLAPGRWLAGDVRWTLVLVTLCTAAAFAALGHQDRNRSPVTTQMITQGETARRSGRLSAALLLLLPGTLTQVEQAWTEPLLLACLTGAVLALARGHDRLAVFAVASALASKQHIVLLLPLLAAWPAFGVRRVAASTTAAALIVLPWFLADPAAMWQDTVRLLVQFPPLRFADTAYIAVLNEFGLRLPFWLTGAIVALTTGVAVVVVRRTDPSPAVFLRWCAVVLFVANLVNKQAFYNQYWLVAGLVLASWAASGRIPDGSRQPTTSRA